MPQCPAGFSTVLIFIDKVEFLELCWLDVNIEGSTSFNGKALLGPPMNRPLMVVSYAINVQRV